MNTDSLRIFSKDVLRPLEQFDHPNLHRRPPHVPDGVADAALDIKMLKSCAGRRHDLRVSGPDMRRIFKTGQFDDHAKGCWRWVCPSIRERDVSDLHAVYALTIYELARGFKEVFGPRAGALAGYFNQWADDPDRPLPTSPEVSLCCHNITLLPASAVAMLPGHPQRRDRAAKVGPACTVLRMGTLNYCVKTDDLNTYQQQFIDHPYVAAHDAWMVDASGVA